MLIPLIVAIVILVYISLLLASFPVFGLSQKSLAILQHEIKERAPIIRHAVITTLVWISVVSPVDCAIPWKGARVVPEWTSPGTGESRRWFYRVVLGSPTSSAEVVLDPLLPHWSFFGRSGYITLLLHAEATLTTIVIESDFPDSMPHDLRVWAFVPRHNQDPCFSQLEISPSFPYQLKDWDLSPLLVGDIAPQANSNSTEHRYHVPRGPCGHIPVGMIMLEFLSNGGSEMIQIRLIRVLGVPS